MCDLLTEVCDDVATAVEDVSDATRHDLWRAIGEWEEQLSRKSLLERVKEIRKARESREVRIVPYESRYQPVFRSLNEQWIARHWQLEAHVLSY